MLVFSAKINISFSIVPIEINEKYKNSVIWMREMKIYNNKIFMKRIYRSISFKKAQFQIEFSKIEKWIYPYLF